jgi:hypothetical protein
MFKPKWLRLPSRVALILGLGALSSVGVRANTPDQSNRLGDVLVRSEGGRIFLLERGRETELRLGATAERDHLLQLLERHGSAGVKLDSDPSLIMAGGGGMGFSLRDLTKPFPGKPQPAAQNPPQVTTPRSSPKQDTGPRDHITPTDKKG